MDMETEFIELANNIRRDIMDIKHEILTNNRSTYNAKVIIDKCEVCKKTGEDVHHIQFQCFADSNQMIGDIHKNNQSNLVTLCKQCHHEVHNKNLVITGYVQTSNGKELLYHYCSQKELAEKTNKRKKYTESDIEIIKQYFTIDKMTRNRAKLILQKKHNISISTSTISKIWKGDY